jgi:hypothetical protein
MKMQRFIAAAGTAALILACWTSSAGAAEEQVPVDQLPKAVLDAVKAKFPGAELQGAEKEDAGGNTIYEVNLDSTGKIVKEESKDKDEE